MVRKLLFLCMLVCVPLSSGPQTAAQALGTPQEVKALLQAISKNIGADNLKCLTYSGSGSRGMVGQNYEPTADWPRVELASYSKTMNFETKSAREEEVRRQGNIPIRGGNMVRGEQKIVNVVSGDRAWNGITGAPQNEQADFRLVDMWHTP